MQEDINTWRSAFLEAVNTSSIVSIIKIKEEVAEGKAIEESLKQENHGEVVERRGKDAELKARRTTVRMQRSVLNLKVRPFSAGSWGISVSDMIVPLCVNQSLFFAQKLSFGEHGPLDSTSFSKRLSL